MTLIAIVAGRHDAPFAEAVRDGLKKSGHEVSLSEILPQHSDSHVVLIWSAALEAAHTIDAQALIGLWSEGRLLVARRDTSPLPLGLRDLPSKGADTSAADICAEFSSGAAAKNSSSRPPMVFLAVAAALLLVGGGAWYYFNKASLERQAALTAAFEGAAKASEELKQAQSRQLEALKDLERARAAGEAARKSGDVAKLKEAQEAARLAEAEASKQAETVKQREAAARKAIADTKRAAEAAKSANAEPQKQETVAAAAPKAPAAAPEASRAPPAAAPKASSRSEREARADEEAARKALEKVGNAPTVASAAPTAAPAAPGAKSATEFEPLYQQALAMENGGDAASAIRIYRRAARAGSGKAAARLGEIYDRGVPGVSRDYAESLQWYETARQLGEKVETEGGRLVWRPRPEPESRTVQEPAAPAIPALTPPPAAPVVSESVKTEPDLPRAPRSQQAEKAAPKLAPATKSREVPETKAAKAPVSEPVAPAPAVTAPKAEAPATAPAKAVPEPAVPIPEAKSEWIIPRWLVIVLIVSSLIAWRRWRRRARKGPALEVPPQAGRPAAQAPADAATLFVSYSHKDRGRVEPIVSAIEGMGRRVWMDRTDITGQTGWAGQIVRAIRECRAVVLMASPNSYGSDQVVRELYLAMNHKKTIVPIEIEPADLPDELQYILAPFQHHRLSGGETREVLGRALAAV